MAGQPKTRKRRARAARPQCQKKTAAGKRCTHKAAPGHLICAQHLKMETRLAEPTEPEFEYDADVAKEIIEFIKQGASPETAAVAAGISSEVIESWVMRNVEGFRDMCAQAIALLEVENLKSISTAAKRDWRAAMWMLEHGPRRSNTGGSIPLRGGGARAVVTTAADDEGPSENAADDQTDSDGRPL